MPESHPAGVRGRGQPIVANGVLGMVIFVIAETMPRAPFATIGCPRPRTPAGGDSGRGDLDASGERVGRGPSQA